LFGWLGRSAKLADKPNLFTQHKLLQTDANSHAPHSTFCTPSPLKFNTTFLITPFQTGLNLFFLIIYFTDKLGSKKYTKHVIINREGDSKKKIKLEKRVKKKKKNKKDKNY